MYVCILHLLRTNMSCKWDGKTSFARIVGAEEEQQTTYKRPFEKNVFLV